MILLTGATDTNGAEIVRQLVASGAPVRALVRAANKATDQVVALQAQGIEIATGDLADIAGLGHALDGVTHALLLPAADPQQVAHESNFIEAALQHGRPHVVKFSMYGAAPDSPFELHRWHAQTEQLLKESGLPWTIIQPNELMQTMHRFEQSIQDQGIIALPLGEGRISMVDLGDVAAVIVKTLTEQGHGGQTYVLTGPEALAYTDIAYLLSTVLEREIRYVDQSPEAFGQTLTQAGAPAVVVDLFLALYAMQRNGSAAHVTTTVSDLLNRPATSFSQFARDWVTTFQTDSDQRSA